MHIYPVRMSIPMDDPLIPLSKYKETLICKFIQKYDDMEQVAFFTEVKESECTVLYMDTTIHLEELDNGWLALSDQDSADKETN